MCLTLAHTWIWVESQGGGAILMVFQELMYFFLSGGLKNRPDLSHHDVLGYITIGGTFCMSVKKNKKK
jgi:hypothetical protein